MNFSQKKLSALLCAAAIGLLPVLSANAAVPSVKIIAQNSCSGCNIGDVQQILDNIENCNSVNCNICDITDNCGLIGDDSQCTDCNTSSFVPSVSDQLTNIIKENTEKKLPEEKTSVQVPENETAVSDVSAYEKQVAELVNQYRAQNGLSSLVLDTELSMVARTKSLDMKNNGYFSHVSPAYGSPFDMMKQFNISYHSVGENIAMGQMTPESVMQAWMNSEGHRANILNPSYTRIGVGYVSDGNYWTQLFIG